MDFAGKQSGPAPRRSLSGIWEFAKGGAEGIGADGAKAMPSDGKPEHELPFTAEGRKAFMANKPTYGLDAGALGAHQRSDARLRSAGVSRIVLHNAHTEQIIQTATQVVILYQFNKKWRVIWTDGRALPRDPEVPAWAIKDAPHLKHASGDIRSAAGWMTIRSSRIQMGSTIERGSTTRAVRTATPCT